MSKTESCKLSNLANNWHKIFRNKPVLSQREKNFVSFQSGKGSFMKRLATYAT